MDLVLTSATRRLALGDSVAPHRNVPFGTRGRVSARGSTPAGGQAVTQIKRLALLLAVGACQKASPAAPPPPEVTVLTVQSQTVPAKFEWVAEAAASKSVEVRAQVSGVVVARPYIEGTDVKKGTVLFRIDPRTYEANYQSAQARVVQARATLGNAERKSVV